MHPKEFINQIWAIISTNENLKPSAARLSSILNRSDILLIIAEEIDINDF